MLDLFLNLPWYYMLLVFVVHYVLLCVFLYYFTYLLFVWLIGYNSVAGSWPWYKKYPYGVAFLLGFFTDLLYNLLGASWVHMYYSAIDCRRLPLRLMFFQYRNWYGWTKLYHYTYTKRIQHVIDSEFVGLKTKTYKWAACEAAKLNEHDPGHIERRKAR